jgi:hypothetical protein
MLSTISKIGYTPAFCKKLKVLLVSEDKNDLQLKAENIKTKAIPPAGDKIVPVITDSAGEAMKILDSKEKPAVTIVDTNVAGVFPLVKHAQEVIGHNRVFVITPNNEVRWKAENLGIQALDVTADVPKHITRVLNKIG